MSARELSHHPAVAIGVWKARVWYPRIDARLAERLTNEFWRCVELACEAPERRASDDRGKRRIRFPSFPCSPVFRSVGNSIRVLALAHGSRNPDYGRHRR